MMMVTTQQIPDSLEVSQLLRLPNDKQRQLISYCMGTTENSEPHFALLAPIASFFRMMQCAIQKSLSNSTFHDFIETKDLV